MRKLLKKQGYAPDELVTDKLGSYGAARRVLRFSCRHEQGLRTNNRAENSHQPVQRRERKQQRFKSAGLSPGFLGCMPVTYPAPSYIVHLAVTMPAGTAQPVEHALEATRLPMVRIWPNLGRN
jgi:DDE domain